MGDRFGVEVSVHTSLNVGGPIVPFPEQALATFHRAKGLDGLVSAGDDGRTVLAWRFPGECRMEHWVRVRERGT